MIKKRKIFYLMAGAGLGNAARFEALYEGELKHSCRAVYLYCWGRSYEYLNKRYSEDKKISMTELRSYSLAASSEGISTIRSLLSIPKYLSIYLKNSLLLFSEIKKYDPDLSVHDSDYHYFPFVLKRVQRFVISQSWMVVCNWEYLKDSNIKTKLNFLLFEVLEFVFTFIWATKIFCPSFSKRTLHIFGKIKIVSPIVRSEFMKSKGRQKKGVAVLSGGSGIQNEKLLKIARKINADIFVAQLESSSNSLYSSIQDSGTVLIAGYNGVVVQAGHVLISECLSSAVKFLPVPIDNHPEQVINAMIMHKEYGLVDYRDSFASEFFLETLNDPPIAALDCVGVKEIGTYLKEQVRC